MKQRTSSGPALYSVLSSSLSSLASDMIRLTAAFKATDRLSAPVASSAPHSASRLPELFLLSPALVAIREVNHWGTCMRGWVRWAVCKGRKVVRMVAMVTGGRNGSGASCVHSPDVRGDLNVAAPPSCDITGDPRREQKRLSQISATSPKTTCNAKTHQAQSQAKEG